jgi:hypothetical protein
MAALAEQSVKDEERCAVELSAADLQLRRGEKGGGKCPTISS